MTTQSLISHLTRPDATAGEREAARELVRLAALLEGHGVDPATGRRRDATPDAHVPAAPVSSFFETQVLDEENSAWLLKFMGDANK